jgi:hypothetical protein
MAELLWKTVWQLLRKLSVQLLYKLAIALLGIHPSKMEMYVHTKTSRAVFTELLFLKAKNWKQSRCPLTGDWLNPWWNAMGKYSLKRGKKSW